MRQTPLVLSVAFSLSALASAQTTWTVQWGGGAGIDFPDLPSAVAGATDGDTILVLPSPFGIGAEPFATDKGLTILGVGGDVPIGSTPGNPFVIEDLPAGSSFRMAGFLRPNNGSLDFRLLDCRGQVHLEDLAAREPDLSFPTTPAIEIDDCDSVVLRHVTVFGAPAVSATSSHLIVSSCRLGWCALGAVGGGGLYVDQFSTAEVVQTQFDAGALDAPCIRITSSAVTLVGDGQTSLDGGLAPVVATSFGTLRRDPDIPLLAEPGFAEISGTASLQVADYGGAWAGVARIGDPLTFDYSGAPGRVVLLGIGTPKVLELTSSSMLAIDLAQPIAFLPAVVLDGAGTASQTVSVPPAIPTGSAIAAQPLLLATNYEIGRALHLVLQ